MNRDIYSGKMMFYSATKRFINWSEIELQLDDDIDKSLLEEVANEALFLRYPYLAKKLVANDVKLYLADNDNQLHIYELDATQFLLGAKNNEFMIRVAVSGSRVGFFFLHAFTDAHGIMPFVKTIIYEYYCRKYGKKYSAPDIYDIHSAMSKLEYTDPLAAYKPKESYDINYTPNLSQEAYQLPEPLDEQGRNFNYKLKIRADQLMMYTKSADGSPNVIFALLVANAILKLHPEASGKIVPGVVVDHRRAINGEGAYQCNIGLLYMKHTKQLEKLPFSKQVTCYRGMIFLQADNEVIGKQCAKLRSLIQMIDGMPTVEAKRQFAQKIVNSMSAYCTCSISCPGAINFGDIAGHIKSVCIQSDMTMSRLVVEISSIENYFYVNIIQGFENPCYVNEIVNFLQTEKIDFELSGPDLLPTVYSDGDVI